MPYIKQELREELKFSLDLIVGDITNNIENFSENRAGVLNYVITSLIDSCYGPLSDAKYKDYNEAIGMLECCKLEFYRKAAAPYEDLKERENGSVLDGGLNGGLGGSKDRKNNTKRIQKNSDRNLVIYKFSPQEGTNSFIRAASKNDARLIIIEDGRIDTYIDLDNINMYKNWNDLEPEIKNVFHAFERDGSPTNIVIFD